MRDIASGMDMDRRVGGGFAITHCCNAGPDPESPLDIAADLLFSDHGAPEYTAGRAGSILNG